jgi:hypothetical protein
VQLFFTTAHVSTFACISGLLAFFLCYDPPLANESVFPGFLVLARAIDGVIFVFDVATASFLLPAPLLLASL